MTLALPTPRRLLWLIDSLNVGGAEALIVPFARGLDGQRYKLTVCALSTISGNPIEDRLHKEGVDVVTLGARSLRDREAFEKLKRLVRDEKIDLVHAHLTYSAIWSAFLSRATRIPSVVSLHVAPEASRALQTSWRQKLATTLRDRLMRFVASRWSSRIIMVSAALRDVYLAGGGVRRAKVRVVRNGIEVERFDRDRDATRATIVREFNFSHDMPIVATVSVLREGKGIDVLIDAAKQVPDASFLIVGDGSKAKEWRQRAIDQGVDGRFRWAGYRTDVDTLLAGCDLFVHPTLSDAFPTVLLEAMAAGLPIVASDVGGVPEIVQPGVTGQLVPPADAGKLAAAIGSVLHDREALHKMGTAARSIARERFSINAWTERLTGVYEEVLR